MARPATRVGRILVTCVRREPPRRGALDAALGGVNFAELSAAAAFHRVVAYVLERLRDASSVAHADLGRMEQLYQVQVRDHLRALHDLTRVGKALDRAGVPWLVIKGPVLARLYPRPDFRSYSDIDLIVPGAYLRDALVLLDDGVNTMIDRNWVRLRHTAAGEVHLRLAHGTTADLHWHLINRAKLRRTFPIDMSSLFQRARSVQLGACPARTLGRADTLVHLGLHGCLSGGNRLVWLKDIEQCLAQEPPEWDEVVSRAREWGADLALAAMLARVRRVLSVEVPVWVGRSLSPNGGWRALVMAADRMAPLERSTGRRSLPRMMALSTESDIRSTLASFARHAGAWFAEYGFLDRGSVPGPDRDPTSRESAMHTAGGDADRSAYLAAVVAECEAAGSHPRAGGS